MKINKIHLHGVTAILR